MGHFLIREVQERRRETFKFKKAESPKDQKLKKVSNLIWAWQKD